MASIEQDTAHHRRMIRHLFGLCDNKTRAFGLMRKVKVPFCTIVQYRQKKKWKGEAKSSESPPPLSMYVGACYLHVLQSARVHVERSHRGRLPQHLVPVQLSPEARQDVVTPLLLLVHSL